MCLLPFWALGWRSPSLLRPRWKAVRALRCRTSCWIYGGRLMRSAVVADPCRRQARRRAHLRRRAIWCSNCSVACRSWRKKSAVSVASLMWPKIMTGNCAPKWKSCAAIWISVCKPLRKGLAGRPPRALLSRGRRRKPSQSRHPPAPREPLKKRLLMVERHLHGAISQPLRPPRGRRSVPAPALGRRMRRYCSAMR